MSRHLRRLLAWLLQVRLRATAAPSDITCPKNPDGIHRYDVRTNECVDCGAV